MVVEKSSKTQSATESIRVLVIEDEAAARDAIHEFLRVSGHDVASAGTASEAFRNAERTPPDVVVCDWRLGDGEDGVDVARKLQKSYGARIIFITAQHLGALRRAAQDLDIELYLRKPISLQALSRAIKAIAA